MRPSLPIAPIRIAAALALLAGVPAGVWAQAGAQGSRPTGANGARRYPVDVESAPRPEARVTRTAARITIDGIPDEAAWAEAEPLTDFIQSMPETGMPATEKTVVRVMYDAERIYISAVCYDSDMNGLIVPTLEQDFETHDSDVLGITLDTYLDRRNTFMWLFNPGGAIKDGQVFDNSRNYNLPWEGVMDYQVAVLDSAWTVEMAIPFTTLRFAEVPGEQSWGANFSRRIRRKNEDAFWAPLARRELLHKMSRAGTLHGFQDLMGGRNISVKPYLTASDASRSLTQSGAGDSGFDGGFDMKWGVTPRLTADATFRTDFSQVEVDQERVNLTR
ncbi:MAG: carbohydrate binding family 9 domain-containing protein, partial [Gemmatimonadetes bacterium]|nr:carbohydrate binding family 9 domain-containing protein [Gemmatimonadota bacterium]